MIFYYQLYAKYIYLCHSCLFTDRYQENHVQMISDHKKENSLQWTLAVYTHVTVGEFFTRNWTDLHFVVWGITANRHIDCC